MIKNKFEFLEHTADIKFKAFGATEKEAFESVVLAISSYISQGKKISSSKGKVINISASNQESLLSKLVDEILFLLDAEDFITVKADITLRGNNLKADLYGDKASNYQDLVYIKAATYAEMHIKKIKSKNPKDSDFWEIQMVLDV